MQPHSMCAVALAGHMWNRYDRLQVSRCRMNVWYEKNKERMQNKYELSQIEETDNRLTLKVYIMRGGGGLACMVKIQRNSPLEGVRVQMTHLQMHVAGLWEEFTLYKDRITNGEHHNSRRYRRFSGEFMDEERKKLRLYCEVKQENGSYISLPYYLEIE